MNLRNLTLRAGAISVSERSAGPGRRFSHGSTVVADVERALSAEHTHGNSRNDDQDSCFLKVATEVATEVLQSACKYWSGRRDLNSRPLARHADSGLFQRPHRPPTNGVKY
jgi:hypothetical protein